ncbi:MAG: GDP-mannose 4,6-dehydratase [Planctomycetota bacterium]
MSAELLDAASGQPVIVTGAAGFIGSHLSQRLLRAGVSVVGVDNLDPFYDASMKRENVASVEKTAGESGASFAFLEADIRDAQAIGRLFEETRPKIVAHMAARAGVRPSIEQPALYASVNLEGTSVLLEAAAKNKVERFAMASSSSVYGNNGKVPFSESDPVEEPISPYAATKRACELTAHVYTSLYDLPVACLRFFTVYGPRQRPDLAISKFLSLVADGKEIPMFGDGTTSRDYTYIDDIIDGVVASILRIPDHGYRIWNLGGNQPVTLSRMIEVIGEAVGREPNIKQLPAQPGDVDRTYADLTRSNEELGYMPNIPFETGVTRQWKSVLDRRGVSA